MSESQHNTTYSATEAAATEPATTTSPTVTSGVAAAEVPAVTESKTDNEAPQTTTEAATEQAKVDAATAPGATSEDAKAEVAAEKAVEPITSGQLSYKGPGLVKSLIPSKKEFWLSDEAVAPQNLDLYLRGEKPEVSHAVVAWASQTGKGLLFLNKKGEADRTHPADVLALYDATDLQKQYPHEITFKLNGHNHTLKATSDVERDGWYLSIEEAIELGKASKEEIRESEGYKAEIEKLNKPNVVGAATTRSLSKPKKSTEVPAAERVGSSDGEASEDKKEKKTQKSRSTSRGLLNRLKGNKDESEQKTAEKKEEKEDEMKAEADTPVLASTEAAPVLAGAAATETPAAADAAAEDKAVETPAFEPKPSKRGSIFGRVSSTFGTLRSPAKEKDQKEAELKAEPVKEGAVSENPPVLPETAATINSAAETAIPSLQEPAAEVKAEVKEAPAPSPSKEKNSLFTGIGGYLKRGRSVSPSTLKKDQTKKDETTTAPVVDEAAAAEPAAKVEEPATQGAESSAEPSTETPVEKVEEQKTETTTPNKRQSVLGSLGRRASKAINRFQAPKKENTAPAATEAKQEETTEAKTVDAAPGVNGEAKKEEAEPKQIGDVVSEAVHAGQPQQQQQQGPSTVTASA